MSSSAQFLIPGNDEDRLLALSRYDVVGTAPEALFDDLVTLTAKLFAAPIALISLVEEDSVWFKANFGLPGADRVPRDESICSVAILQNSATVFEDLEQEPCTLVEPRVLQQLNMNFYAAQPLRTVDGFNIGTLCVIDQPARMFSPAEQRLLQHLAVTVMLLLELRQAHVTLLGPLTSTPDPTYVTVPSLVHSLTLLAEIGSTGAAVDARGNAVGTKDIHEEAGHLTQLINQTISAALAG